MNETCFVPTLGCIKPPTNFATKCQRLDNIAIRFIGFALEIHKKIMNKNNVPQWSSDNMYNTVQVSEILKNIFFVQKCEMCKKS